MTRAIDQQLPPRLEGAIWGHLVGDAVGVPYEFREPSRIGAVRFGERGSHGQPPGTWSDDGALMLALLDSLVSVGFDTDDQGRRALKWFRDGANAPGGVVFDYGGTTATALHAIEQGSPAEEAGPTGEHNQSNGSLMRILPLGLWGHRLARDEQVALAARASRVTHGHPVCQAACAVYVLIVDALLDGLEPAPAMDAALAEVGAGDRFGAAFIELRDWPHTHEPGGHGGVLDAFWSAWTAFTGASGYRDTIERAIQYGHDTDTTAAIAGGLAGAYWGIDGIPAEWLAGMRGRDIVAPLVDRLVHARGDGSGGPGGQERGRRLPRRPRTNRDGGGVHAARCRTRRGGGDRPDS